MIPIQGKQIVITGKLPFLTREQAFKLIYSRGGIPKKTVTKETDYLVIGTYRKGSLKGNKSNKLKKTEKYMEKGRDIKIITGEEFMKSLGIYR